MPLTVAQLTARLTADTSGFYRGMAIANASMIRTGGIVSRVAAGTSLAVGGMGLLALRAAGDFERSMNVLRAVSGATESDFGKLQKKAIALGGDLRLPGVSAKDAAEGMTQLARGGMTANQVMDASRGTLLLGTAAQIDFKEAADMTTRALKMFHMPASDAGRVANVLAAGANASTASMTDMAYGLMNSGMSANQLGVSVEETVGSLAMLVDAGLSGERAGTALSTMFYRLASPTKDAAAMMDKLNITAFDANGKFRGLQPVIQDFAKATANMGEQQRLAMFKTIFGMRANQAMMGLLDRAGNTQKKYTQAVTGTNAAQVIAEARMKGFNGALEKVNNAVSTLAIEVGTKMLPAATQAATAFANWVDSLSPEDFQPIGDALKFLFEVVKGLVTFVAQNANWAVPLATGAIVGIKAFKMLTAAVAAYRAMAVTAAAAQVALLGPIGLIAIALAALAAGFLLAYTHSARFREAVNNAIASLSGLPEMFAGVIARVKTIISDLAASFNEVWARVRTDAQTFWNTFGGFITGFLSTIGGQLRGALQGWLGIFKGTWQAISGVVRGEIQIIKGIINTVMGVLSGDWTRAWNGIKQIVGGVWTAISGVVRGAITALRGVIQGAMTAVRATMTGAWNAIRALTSGAWNGIKAVVSGAIGAVKSVVSSGVNAAKSAATSAWNALKSATSSAFNALPGIVRSALAAIVAAVSGLAGMLASAGAAAGRALGQGLVNGITGMAGAVASAAKGLASKAAGAVAGALGIGSPSRVMHGYGVNMGEGLIRGWLAGTRELPEKIKTTLKNALEAGKRQVETSIAGFEGIFSKLSDKVMSAFDAATAGHQTPAEKAIAQINKAVTEGRLKENLQNAKDELAKLVASGGIDVKDMAAAERELADAQEALTKFQAGPTASELRKLSLEAQDAALKVRELEQRLQEAQNPKTTPGASGAQRTTAANRVANAQISLTSAQRKLTDAKLAGAPASKIADLEAAVEKAENNLESAKAAYNGLKEAVTEPVDPLAVERLQVELDEAKLKAEETAKALASAGTPDPTKQAELEQAVTDAQARITEIKTKGAEDLKAAEEAVRVAERESLLYHLEQRAITERKEYEARRTRQKEHLEGQLAGLEANLKKHPERWKFWMARVNKVLKAHGITFKKSGALLGTAFAQGLRESIAAAARAARGIASAIEDILKLRSPAKKGPLSDLDTWWKPFGKTLVSSLRGGDIENALTGALVSPRGSSLAAGLGGAGGGSTVHIEANFPNYVGSRDELDMFIRDSLNRAARFVPGGAVSGQAVKHGRFAVRR